MKKFLLLICLAINLYAQSLTFNLEELAGIVASENRINIVISETLDKASILFYVQETHKYMMMNIFKRMLQRKGLLFEYDRIGKFYYISKKTEPDKERLHLYSFTMQSLNYEHVKETLKNFDVKHAYIEQTNTISVVCTAAQKKAIERFLKLTDVVPEQFRLKISIIETNNNRVKERGVNLNAFMQSLTGSVQFFVNLLTMPYSTKSNTFDEKASFGITGALKFLDDEGYTRLQSSPYMTVQSGKQIYFSTVDNVPYETGSATVTAASESAVTSIDYRDVGMKITLKPLVVNEIIYIDLMFVMEYLLTTRTLTPSTAKRELSTNFQLRKGQTILLSGINSNTTKESDQGIPIIKEVPVIGSLMSYEKSDHTTNSLTIMIQVM